MQEPIEFSPAVTAMLASTFKLIHLSDDAAGRAADNAIRYLSPGPAFVFDPTESRAASERGSEQYVTDGTYCTCKASKGLCKHRVAHRLALAQLALTDPAALVRLIVEQAVPPAADAVDVTLAGGPAAAIAATVEAPYSLADDSWYADLVAGIAELPTPATTARMVSGCRGEPLACRAQCRRRRG
jgi:hypothetical protein